MKNFIINACLTIVCLFIGMYVGGCMAEERRQLELRLRALEGKK